MSLSQQPQPPNEVFGPEGSQYRDSSGVRNDSLTWPDAGAEHVSRDNRRSRRDRFWPALVRIWMIASACAAVGICFLVASARTDASSAALLRVRDLLFTKFSADTAELSLPPGRLVARGFRTDSRATVRSFSSAIEASSIGNQMDSIAGIRSAVERAQKLVEIAYANGRQRGCGTITNLLGKIAWVHAGGGCCSDYTEVFLALSSVAKLSAREVSFGDDHTVAAFYDPGSSRWIFIDPFYGLMARDSAGAWMSTRDVQDLMSRGQPPSFVFVGNPNQPYAERSESASVALEQVARHNSYVVTFGNNVIGADRAYQRLRLLPKPVVQLVGFATNARPMYRVYDSKMGPVTAALLNARRWLAIACAVLLVIGLALCAFVCLRLARRWILGVREKSIRTKALASLRRSKI